MVRINEPVLNAIIKAVGNLAGKVDAEKPRIDGLLGLRGVIDVADAEESEEEKAAAEDAIVEGLRRRP